ncbi:UNVERIFIED_CONTAM: hypothetical protein GTU68_036592 [Idotea baltica]|nr:hypothetical protein [Idotea baltica]
MASMPLDLKKQLLFKNSLFLRL